jgi:hypothetical protein
MKIKNNTKKIASGGLAQTIGHVLGPYRCNGDSSGFLFRSLVDLVESNGFGFPCLGKNL